MQDTPQPGTKKQEGASVESLLQAQPVLAPEQSVCPNIGAIFLQAHRELTDCQKSWAPLKRWGNPLEDRAQIKKAAGRSIRKDFCQTQGILPERILYFDFIVFLDLHLGTHPLYL